MNITDGISLFNQNKYREALSFFEEYVKENPGDGRAYYYIGMIYDGRNKERIAIGYYKRALELGLKDKELISCLLSLSSSLRKVGEYEEPLKYLEKAEELGSRDPFLYYVRSLCLMKLGRIKEAEENIEIAIKLNPKAIIYRRIKNEILKIYSK
ncbi:tetratricopeptide repeat protein [Sulfuracidifex tepidarius]|uniref:Photosystem I assembly protein Ycf3 n=1 Tax=Sulfuracidifex tepidarius TaxID=1294262 RepID=A0A510E663_9CREN|nr:tetratricopeptide repeat protein [Sulfuracidifex tepidarius]BBG25206.1 Photosystem I assembly protein Ycf3 [Sulfuracidifex tepidarius]BBG27999.1 Photosystem I assembly protein Ycf3 [Sulfuracidifex tepidarius]